MIAMILRKVPLYAATLILCAGCLIVPVRQRTDETFDREKALKYSQGAVITVLDAVLAKQGFTVTAKDATRGNLVAEKTGVIDSDYGYYRFQKYCLFWGYGSYGKVVLEARADFLEPKKTILRMRTTPKGMGAGKILDKTFEELELKLFLEDKGK